MDPLSGRRVFDLLLGAAQAGPSAAQELPAGVLRFGGRSALTAAQGFAAQVGDEFSLLLTVQQRRRTSGYLVYKASGGGAVRHFALFSSRTRGGALVFSYTHSRSARVASVRFPSPLRDGAWHRLLLTVSGHRATLAADGAPPQQRKLRSGVSDCGAGTGDCVWHIGERSGGAGRFKGKIFAAQLLADTAVAEMPDPAPHSPLHFAAQAARYLPARNDLGSFPSGVPLSDCATRCLALQQCRSFDAGRVGARKQGACYLSSSTEGGEEGLDLRRSTSLDYFQRL